MKKNKKATSIVEAMIVMVIIVSWVTWMYKIYSESIKLSNSTTNKIQAIQIAKQWIEAFTNIRDTNWLLFSSDYTNCWNTLNYDSDCIWWWGNKIKNIESYIIYRNNNKWVLTNTWNTTDTFWSWTYIDDFRVWLNSEWIYTQTWIVSELKPIFTRELQISYTGSTWPSSETDPKIIVKSLVQWVDNSWNWIHEVEFEQVLSNWKK